VTSVHAMYLASFLAVLTIGLAHAGRITPASLRGKWRWVLAAIIFGGIFAPANEPVDWVFFAITATILYIATCGVVLRLERARLRNDIV